MRAPTRLIAAMQLTLILPAALFMTAVLVGAGHVRHDDLARIVNWYSARIWTLWLLLLALPFGVLVAGCATLLHSGVRRSLAMIPAPVATLFVAGLTLASAGILAIVALHILAN